MCIQPLILDTIYNLIYIWVYNYETLWFTSPNLFLTNLICPYSVPNWSMNPTFILFLYSIVISILTTNHSWWVYGHNTFTLLPILICDKFTFTDLHHSRWSVSYDAAKCTRLFSDLSIRWGLSSSDSPQTFLEFTLALFLPVQQWWQALSVVKTLQLSALHVDWGL